MSTPFCPKNYSPAIPFPDAAWTPWYVSPQGYEGEPCQHRYQRGGVGPYPGKEDVGFIADVCPRCGRILRSVRDISWRDYFWARAYNRRAALSPEKP